MKKAFITGVNGQNGSYLAELLIHKGYEVHGVIRRSSTFNRERIEHLHDYENTETSNLALHYGDMTDSSNLTRLLKEIEPHEVYHLAAQSHVQVSFEVPEYTLETDGVGTLRLLEAIRLLNLEKTTKIFNASTSELFGLTTETPQNEHTGFHPRSPYAVAKLCSHWIAMNYREAYKMQIWNGILFNHESPRRGENFVSRKITLSIARILAGKQHRLLLGNLDAKRDWGYAPDYVEAMWLMLQQPQPDDFVIATGEAHSVREFVQLAFHQVGIRIRWEGSGTEEQGINADTGDVLVEVSPKYFRPSEVDSLVGDATKARTQLGWSPKIMFPELVQIMMTADLAREGLTPKTKPSPQTHSSTSLKQIHKHR